VREQSLVVEAISAVSQRLPFALRGLDTDNDSAFMNETLQSDCQRNHIEWTRSRAYLKSDQAWVEQQNGAVVRRLAGYGRLSGLAVEGWLVAEPNLAAGELLTRLRQRLHDLYPTGAQLRTLQRRVKAWRAVRARQLVFAAAPAAQTGLAHTTS
jgi:hypothetical protein